MSPSKELTASASTRHRDLIAAVFADFTRLSGES
jgi:hypothetical protein